MKPIVFLEKIEKDSENLEKQFMRSFKSLSIADDFNKANAIFIKPNLTYPKFKKGVTTRVEYIESLVAALRRINNTAKIYIGEGEGGYNSFSMTEAMHSMGFYELEKRFQNIKVVNVSKIPTRMVELKVKGKPYPISLPELFFDEIDFSITCPVPKVHCMTKISLSFKNQWGCLPDTMRMKNHYVFDKIIGQICNHLKFKYAFLDGKYGLDKNGPMVGKPFEINWFVASNSLGAFDVVVSEMMGFNWRDIGHLGEAANLGFIPDRKDISVIGDLEPLKIGFSLKRNFWNYPALFAFNSKKLTHFFYFSKYAKFLHDVMYLFRKRPLD
ncbi:hypothetical protein CVT91_00440 [Candidatus Atribacteria bacterium HGW-Atribacteria-1]|nr:MAG: hypothetical protein CVT91_00440 [Candidatus Atribacteria bacterium HGW-Atribacteria-1]